MIEVRNKIKKDDLVQLTDGKTKRPYVVTFETLREMLKEQRRTNAKAK